MVLPWYCTGKKISFFFLIAIVRSITFLTGLSEAKLSNRSLQGESLGHKLTPFASYLSKLVATTYEYSEVYTYYKRESYITKAYIYI